jgi:hypothetical protein
LLERGSEGKWEWLTPALRSGDAGRLSSSEEPSICNAVWLEAKQVARNAFCLKCLVSWSTKFLLIQLTLVE